MESHKIHVPTTNQNNYQLLATSYLLQITSMTSITWAQVAQQIHHLCGQTSMDAMVNSPTESFTNGHLVHQHLRQLVQEEHVIPQPAGSFRNQQRSHPTKIETTVFVPQFRSYAKLGQTYMPILVN